MMPCINWGVPNKVYQPIIAPSASSKLHTYIGRPDHLCIMSPEFATGSTCHEKHESPELIARKAAEKAATAIRQAERARMRNELADARADEAAKVKAAEKEARAKRSADNKIKGVPKKRKSARGYRLYKEVL